MYSEPVFIWVHTLVMSFKIPKTKRRMSGSTLVVKDDVSRDITPIKFRFLDGNLTFRMTSGYFADKAGEIWALTQC